MKTDDLIDDVARAMTKVEGRPDMRTRVLAAIERAPREQRPAWIVPAAVMGAAGCAALLWVVSPTTAPVAPTVETTVAERVVDAPAPGGNAPEDAEDGITVPVDRPATTAPHATPRAPVVARAVAPATTYATPAWDPVPPADVPSLPPLAGPPPIVIEPIVWSEITITPVDVQPIEVKALVIEPLEVTRLGGV